MTNPELAAAAERLIKAKAGTPLNQIYQFPIEGNRLLDYVNVADAYLAQHDAEDDGKKQLYNDVMSFIDDSIDDFYRDTPQGRTRFNKIAERLATALGITTKGTAHDQD